jgi:hypothetical protein
MHKALSSLAFFALFIGMVHAQTGVSKPVITNVSMFKNGFAFITRQIEMKGDEATIVEVPQASMGTLWFWAPDGEVVSVTATDEVDSQEVELSDLDQILKANIGKRVSISYINTANENREVSGKIFSVGNDIVVINGTVLTKGRIISVTGQGEELVWKQKMLSTVTSKFYKINSKGVPKVVKMMSLERGMTWAPGYAIDITNPDNLTFASKATLLNDLIDFKGVNVRLVTGFPNLQFKDILDPFTAKMPLNTWLAMLNGQPVDSLESSVLTQNNAYAFGGRVQFSTADAAPISWSGPNSKDVLGEQISDLFFYDLPNFQMAKGARIYHSLSRFEADYKHVYTWQVEDALLAQQRASEQGSNYSPAKDVVWHTIKFNNKSGKPLTTAPATFFSKGELVGQTTLFYSPSGSECEVQINKALEIKTDSSEEEVSRVRGAIKNSSSFPLWDLVTVKGTLEINNGRSEKITMQIDKAFSGEFISGTNTPNVVKNGRGLRQINPQSTATWKPSIEAGQKLRIEYSYKLYVQAQP